MSKNRFGVDTDGRLVVLGGGESGVGAAILGKVKGMDVFLSDMGEISSKYKAMLDSYSIPYEEGKHTEDEILDADLYFIDKIGLKEHLSPTRSNGLVAMVKQIHNYAKAYKMLDTSK